MCPPRCGDGKPQDIPEPPTETHAPQTPPLEGDPICKPKEKKEKKREISLNQKIQGISCFLTLSSRHRVRMETNVFVQLFHRLVHEHILINETSQNRCGRNFQQNRLRNSWTVNRHQRDFRALTKDSVVRTSLAAFRSLELGETHLERFTP